MPRFVVTMSVEQKAALEGLRERLGLRSKAHVIRYLIDRERCVAPKKPVTAEDFDEEFRHVVMTGLPKIIRSKEEVAPLRAKSSKRRIGFDLDGKEIWK